MRALVVTNMYPTPRHPARGSFVRDQVRALERMPDVEVELFAFDSGGAGAYAGAGRELRRRFAGSSFDVIHAHFGLTAWPAFAVRGRAHAVTLHGTDVMHPRSRAITFAALPFVDLVAPVSQSLARELPQRAIRHKLAVLPCGVDTERFRPIPRNAARRELGLDPDRPCLLFPADPSRPVKRYDRAREVAGDVPLMSVGDVDPDQMPLWINAANAVVVPSERESFGMSVLEALACGVPVLATPVGVAPEVLAGLDGVHCGPFDVSAWRAALAPLLARADPRVQGRARAEERSATRMAERVLAAWRAIA
jgi:glycosyltransferase involved in cell wall biosynthesis